MHPGGKGANQAVAAARLGAAVWFVGCVGDDPFARILTASLESAQVSTAHLRTATGPTGVALITITPDGENSITVAPGANNELEPQQLDEARELLVDAVMVMQLEISDATVNHAVRVAGNAGARVLLNAAPARPLPEEVIGAADPLIVNETEAAYYLQDTLASSEPGMAAQLRTLGAASVVVTMGAAGAFVVTDAVAEHIPAPAAMVVDTTGAGDSFVGALAAELAAGADLVDAARFGVRVSAATVGRPGAQTSFPKRADLPAVPSVVVG
jgi:ribokinase